jgi:hypothetical protein
MNGNIENIHRFLNRYREIEKNKNIQENALLFCFILIFVFITLVIIEKFVPFVFGYSYIYKLVFFGIIIASLLKIFYIKKKWENLPFDGIAIKIEKEFPFLNNLLINSVQISRKIGKYPEVFIDALKEKTIQAISRCDIEKIVDRKKLKKNFRITVFSILALLICISIAPQSTKNVFMKIFASSSFIADIIVEPGNCSIERGAPLIIRARLKTSGIPEIEIREKSTNLKSMIQDGGTFVYTIPGVTSSFSYRIVSNGKKSLWYRVNVIDKTLIKTMRITYNYPSYTGIRTRTEERIFSEINALQGTNVIVQFYFNNPVGDTILLFSSGQSIINKGTSKTKSFSFTVNDATFYEVHYYDPATKKILSSGREKITPIFDQIPFCEFVSPGKDITADSGSLIPITLKATDDFGITTIKFRLHQGEGEISNNDRVFLQTTGNNKKELTINTTLKVPAVNTKIAYYAECSDNSPTKNIGRSSIYFIYPFSSASKGFSQKKNTEAEKKYQEKLEQAKKLLEKFIEEQKKVVEAAKKLGSVKNLANSSDLQDLAEKEKKWAEMFQKIVNDLNKIAQQTQGKFTLSDEFVEMISHLQAASNAMEKNKPITIPIQESQMGLELAKELVSNLERWLAEAPDSIKWDHQEPSKPITAPEAELPSELEDIIGDLIEQEENMKEEIEDITSSWMDSLDKGAGWMAMDGSISNMSAKGITGNILPNQQEIGGRSGEGRTGRSYGEMVEKTASGKGGRQTPARLTPDNIEPGQVQDASNENQIGPTGGGKTSGWGPRGLKGPVNDASFRYAELAEKQTKIIEKAEKLERELKILNIYNPQLERSISAMKQFTIQLKEGRYNNLLTTKQMTIAHLKQAQQVLTYQAIVKVENSERVEKKKRELSSMWDEKIPSGYEGIVRKYYENISGR